MRLRNWLYAAAMITILMGCGHPASHNATLIPQPTAEATAEPTQTSQPTEAPLPFTLTSPAFEEGGVIPRDFACTGANASPQLDWSEPPAGTQSFALVFNDLDASSRGFVHWVVYNIPADARGLPAGIPAGPQIDGGAVHGSNGSNAWGRTDYGGPCPPEGSTHTYVFTLYALDAVLDLEPGATKVEFEEAAQAYILATATLTASFSR